MFTNFQLAQLRFSKKLQNLQRLDLILAIFTSLIGFFCGSICFTWSSGFFDWNGAIGLLILLLAEFTGLMTNNTSLLRPQSIFSFNLCLIYFRRGFLFALLADGFKVGS
jgi:hypothetical protein